MQKWSRRALLLGGVALLSTGCTHGLVGQALYSVGVRGEGNLVTITPDNIIAPDPRAPQTYHVHVASLSGIGQATIAWWDRRAPQQLLFSLELKGLERFQLHWGDTLINVTVNASTQHIMQSVQKGEAAESRLVAASPFWMETLLPTVSSHGFTLATPPAFAQDGPRLWTIAWVDFYR